MNPALRLTKSKNPHQCGLFMLCCWHVPSCMPPLLGMQPRGVAALLWCLEHNDKMIHSWHSVHPQGDIRSSSVTSLRLCIYNRVKQDADFKLCIWMEPQTTCVPLKNEQHWRQSPVQPSLLIYHRPKLLTVEWSRRADASQETHCNKMNCHCFLAELYKLPHQSSNMGPPPPAINQRERHARHEMS